MNFARPVAAFPSPARLSISIRLALLTDGKLFFRPLLSRLEAAIG